MGNEPMQIRPFFSIVSVALNDLDGLKKTWLSVKEQTFTNFELVVVDGGSSDGTIQWLKGLGHDHVAWTSEPDDGLYEAMNKGLARARGLWVVFLNSGDWFAGPDVLERVAKAIASRSPAFVYGQAFGCDGKGNLLYRPARNISFLPLGMFARHQSMFFERIAAQRICYRQQLRISADYAFVVEFLNNIGNVTIHSGKVLRLNFPVSIFSQGGIYQTKRVQALLEEFWIRSKLFNMSIMRNSIYTVFNLLAHYIKKWRFLAQHTICR